MTIILCGNEGKSAVMAPLNQNQREVGDNPAYFNPQRVF